ncbi:hypothetical protein ACJMK2_005153 [Sinanodonta woodiana]|uniref:Uncharacterized protein n=1 Tax=Sinanodonta woodiana TaxID=1069815 RepID=A0ABD3VQG8_SINWO
MSYCEKIPSLFETLRTLLYTSCIPKMSNPQLVITRCFFLSLICIPLLLPSASSREINPPSPRCIDVHGKCLPRCVHRPDLPINSRRIRQCDGTVLICHNQQCGCIRKNLLDNIY